jgi:hypothetical protein
MTLVYRVLADVVLVAHFGFVLSVVLGLLAIVGGLALGKSWARSFWLRLGHLTMILVVVAQSWAGVICPLTTLENSLRWRANQEMYPRDFIGYWIHKVMYFTAPPWVFISVYTSFAALVVATFVFGPPHGPRRSEAS